MTIDSKQLHNFIQTKTEDAAVKWNPELSIDPAYVWKTVNITCGENGSKWKLNILHSQSLAIELFTTQTPSRLGIKELKKKKSSKEFTTKI